MSLLIEKVPSNPAYEDRDTILRLLDLDNKDRLGFVEGSDFAVLLRDPDSREVIGGLWAEDDFAWGCIRYLLVPQKFRGKKIGERMIAEAETIAQERGKIGLWLTTFDFQARGFYEKLGYRVFGRLEGLNENDGQTFMRKVF